jgi:membrane protein DedA with SNARE-associated domain
MTGARHVLKRLTAPLALCVVLGLAGADAADDDRAALRGGVTAERGVERVAAWANPYLERWGCVAVFATVAIEAFGIPAPGHTMVVAAALAAARGTLDIRLVLLAGALGTLLGSHVAWSVGRLAGGVFRRRGRYVGGQLQKMERIFARWGGLVVVFGPFLEGVRQLNALAAGALAMPWIRFAICNLAGTALWTGAWGAGTCLLAENIEGVLAIAERARPWLLGVTAAAVAIGFALLAAGRRR